MKKMTVFVLCGLLSLWVVYVYAKDVYDQQAVDGTADLSTQEGQVEEQEEERPDPPTNVEVRGTFVSWHAVREDDIVSYVVYRDGTDDEFEEVGRVAANERKTFVDPDAGGHRYYITSVDEAGRESEPSEVVSE
ncbi:fibronectin type III domain-containing protein [Alkalicoccobacillus porphyridii]|uniref:Fibronectin type III domain-containing protein n=1 Tax=Alkalicoccobacillus porphyridii TaxID=2597270 RepID=A0A554A0G5_9BACI|nr:fibronectin type III domain-containing protein [Alkalicoccobacillus porphyridii]TSB47189.1 fibronectin type III domain-containing protein [Alkalicoccobacillus porphyridii]